MVQVTLKLVADAEGTQEMIQTLRSLMLAVQAAPGFRHAQLLREVDPPHALVYIEEWNSQDDLDRQIRSAHYTRLLALMETAAEPPEFRLRWIAEDRGLAYLEHIRLGDR